MRKLLLPLLVVAALLSGCGKEEIGQHPAFIGSWDGYDDLSRYYTIDISPSGDVYYYRQGIGWVERTGDFKVVGGGDKVKLAGKKMDILRYPTNDSANYWQMQLDDIVLEAYK